MVPPPNNVPPPFMLKELAIKPVPNTWPTGKLRPSQRSATKSNDALQSKLKAVRASAHPMCTSPMRRKAAFRSDR